VPGQLPASLQRGRQYVVVTEPPLDAERWHRLKSLFNQAMLQDADVRRAWLDRHCDDDAELRRLLDELLACADYDVEIIGMTVSRAAARLLGESEEFD